MKRLDLRHLALLAVPCLLTSLAAAADWPRFRGPNGAGTAPDTTLPVHFKEGDGILWKVPLPGLGNSSPVVAGGKLFVQSAAEDGRERSLLCLDATTGKTLWSRPFPGAMAKTHARNSLASNTPAVDGERVLALFWDGQNEWLTAHDLEGNLQWKRDVGPHKSQHGSGTSPIVDGGLVYVNRDQDDMSELLAFDAKSGTPRWTAERKGYKASYTAPMLLERDGGARDLVVFSTAGVTGYDPASGKVRWHQELDWSYTKEPLRSVASAVAWRDVVYFHGGNGAGHSRIVAVRAGGPGRAPEILWEKRKGFPYVPCLLAQGDYLFTVTDRGGVAGCYEAATGKELWSERLGGNGNVFASPVLVGGNIYAINEEGIVYVYPAANHFKLLGRNPLGEPVISSPAVADGRLYVRGQKHLFCIGRAN